MVVRKRKKTTKSKSKVRRRTTARRPVPVKTTAKTKRKTSSTSSAQQKQMIKHQIAIFKNAHAPIAVLPKIPDGKASSSLGLSNQTAGELVGATETNSTNTLLPRDGTIHILLFPGMTSNMVVWNSVKSGVASDGTDYNNLNAAGQVIGFDDNSMINFDGLSNGSTGGLVSVPAEFAKWRSVSTGLKLGLLNPAETDDGWWESYRVQQPLETEDYSIKPVENGSNNTSGTVVPYLKLAFSSTGGLAYRSDIANQRTYRTGLLRDIHKEYFGLSPQYGDHDFSQQMNDYRFADNTLNAVSTSPATPAAGHYVRFNAGFEDAQEFINGKIDKNFDMIYIRIHGRSDATPSRIHYNLVANHEVIYPTLAFNSRFHTASLKDLAAVEKARAEAQAMQVDSPGG